MLNQWDDLQFKNNRLLSIDPQSMRADRYLRRLGRAIDKLTELLRQWEDVNRKPEGTSRTEREMKAQLTEMHELRNRVHPSKPSSELKNRQDPDSDHPIKARDHDSDGGKPKLQEGRYHSKAYEDRLTTSDQERGQERRRQTNHTRYHVYHSARGRRAGDQYD